jgi:hypothetical protein
VLPVHNNPPADYTNYLKSPHCAHDFVVTNKLYSKYGGHGYINLGDGKIVIIYGGISYFANICNPADNSSNTGNSLAYYTSEDGAVGCLGGSSLQGNVIANCAGGMGTLAHALTARPAIEENNTYLYNNYGISRFNTGGAKNTNGADLGAGTQFKADTTDLSERV